MATPRGFRFGTHLNFANSGEELAEIARRSEGSGFSTLTLGDHFRPQLAPIAAITAVLAATTELRAGALVFGNDYRHPVVLAKEIATADLLSGGRVQVGIGAGWLKEDYEWAGMPLDPPGTRVDRLAESLQVLKGLWADGSYSFAGEHYTIDDHDGTPTPVQRPHPPILIGAGGRRMLKLAAREADIIGITMNQRAGVYDPKQLLGDADNRSPDVHVQRLEWVKEAAGARFDDIELSAIPMVALTDDRTGKTEEVASAMGVSTDFIESAPQFLIGSAAEIRDQIVGYRERFGISYWIFFHDHAEGLAPVVAELAGA